MVTEKKRASNNKWDAKNMTVLGVKVRKEYADEVRETARRNGDTVNGILKEALRRYMEEKKE